MCVILNKVCNPMQFILYSYSVQETSTVPWQRALKPTMAVKTNRNITNFIFSQNNSLPASIFCV